MGQASVALNPTAVAAKKKLAANFRRQGILIALFSGLCYGFYTAFMTLGMSKGVWVEWYGENSGLSAFAVMYLLSAVGAATTDTCSALWAVSIAGVRGRFTDFLRCIKTKPGLVMVAAAIIGGPLASTAYVVGLQLAGSLVVPIAALCPAIGAILGRILFKQELNSRMVLGIAICFIASFMIGSTGLGDNVPDNLLLGLFFGFIAALFWGLEGCVCGYGTSMIDPEIGITIRQVTAGLSNLLILVPLFGMIAHVDSFTMVVQSFTDSEAILWFALAGLSAYGAFMYWYKGNAMCGAALGMSCNGTFSFWGPFCCWIILGVVFGFEGWSMPPIAWAAAVVMVIGIFIIAMNPLDMFKKNDQEAA
ncbi:membrane protein [Maridesulfovibrio zosterae]|uniref:membrane protein n=1 Tax=Maridesulfovibrio zosterae TaxID=82171 RepID=UPI000419CCF5|nr:membrane protein [Maridesulfovibrio zosterae]